MLTLSASLGIDLGTSNLLVYVKGKGIVLREPSVVATVNDELLAVGEEASHMEGRTPESINVVRPLRDGVIANFTVTRQMLKYLLDKVCGPRRLFKPQVAVSVPSGATSVERRAVVEAALAAGAKRAVAVEEPLAAAIGAGLSIMSPAANLLVDIGGGTTDLAIISLGGVVVSDSIRLGGDKMDEHITRHLRRAHDLMIGERTAEDVKIRLGSAWPLPEEMRMSVSGRDLVTGLPKTVEITASEIREALNEPVMTLVSRVKQVLEGTGPELSADIMERGITLTGGVALLRGLDQLLGKETGVPVRVAEDPLSCVCVGTGLYLDLMSQLPPGPSRYGAVS
jgi:rod shape-determining protein MreB